MGKPTGNKFDTMKGLGRGSDYHGGCEMCGKHMSETFLYSRRIERVRENGEIYSSPVGAGVFAHEKCIRDKWPGVEEIPRTSNSA